MTNQNKSRLGLFVFRRDLRLEDNIGLYNACKECDKVICIFCLDPRQTNRKLNEFFSENAFGFMLESLVDLPIHIIEGNPEKIIYDIVIDYKVDAVYANADYTKYAIERDKNITDKLSTVNSSIVNSSNVNSSIYIGIPFKTYTDVCLNSPLDIKPYKVFTPYYNVAKKIKVASRVIADTSKIIHVKSLNVLGYKITDKNLIGIFKKFKLPNNPHRAKGGAIEAKKALNKLPNLNYKLRDLLSEPTSQLSPYIKFGVVSIRDVYRKSPMEMFTRQLYWRDFYLQVGYHFPHVYGKNFKYTMKWKKNDTLFDLWCTGDTGIPLVDAGMRQLNLTGYMHNRTRMVCANVLTRLFHIDWRRGEKYFASKLTDYDPANNNGGWQWASGTGADPQPYYRIFNPYTQLKKCDPNCEYVRKYATQYADLTNKEILNYISDKFDYELERNLALTLYKPSS